MVSEYDVLDTDEFPVCFPYQIVQLFLLFVLLSFYKICCTKQQLVVR